jgi:hypothetical protein
MAQISHPPEGPEPYEMDDIMQAERLAKAGTPYTLKAKSSNNWLALEGVDNRTVFARRFRDLVEGMSRDLGIAEIDLGDSLKLQIRNAALLGVQFEQAQARALRGEPVEMLAIIRMQNSLARALWALGLGKRRRKTLTPEDPLDYARRYRRKDTVDA